MAAPQPPFATVADLRLRWKDCPAGEDSALEAALEDASQYILDVCASAVEATASTLRRVVCAVVKRSRTGDEEGFAGAESIQEGTGPFQSTFKPSNPHGDFYLTRQERKSLGEKTSAFEANMLTGQP